MRETTQSDPVQAVGAAIQHRGRVGVAVSGGIDSVVLLHATSRALGGWSRPVVLHLDHGLRDDSAADARFVHDLATELKCPLSADAAVNSGSVEGSIEDWARRARYAFFEDAARRNELDVLLLGHHADDQAETVALQVLRGSLPAGCRGMPRERALAAGHPTRLLRPLLGFSRAALEEWAKKNRLTWRDDPSNLDEGHRRNALRHGALDRGGEELKVRLQRLGARSREMESRLGILAGEIGVAGEGDRRVMDAEAWREAPAAVARRALDRLLREMGCGPAGRALFDSLRDPGFRGGSVDREVKVVDDGRGRLVFERAAD